MYVRILPVALIIGALLFVAAGRVDVPAFWAYPVLVWGMAATIYTLAWRRHPGLVRERFKPPNDRDRATRRIALPLMGAHYVLAALDVGRAHYVLAALDVGRFGWSHVPVALQLLGFGLVTAGLGFVGWTLVTNPFASSAVRIQKERDHHVITTGPYAIVRHPMYLGVFLFGLGSSWALGSWWAGLCLVPVLTIFVRRTLLEDRMLKAELEGYGEYAARVRSRILPGVF